MMSEAFCCGCIETPTYMYTVHQDELRMCIQDMVGYQCSLFVYIWLLQLGWIYQVLIAPSRIYSRVLIPPSNFSMLNAYCLITKNTSRNLCSGEIEW